MRDTSHRTSELCRGNPRWGFITERMICHMATRHGPPTLYAVNGFGIPYLVAAAGGHDLVTGNRWGTPMYRFSNGAELTSVATGVHLGFSHPTKPWWYIRDRDYTLAFIARVPSIGFVNPKYAFTLQSPDWAYRFEWINAFRWRCGAFTPPSTLKDYVKIDNPRGTILSRWYGVVLTVSGADGAAERTIYAGTCDGEYYGKGSTDTWGFMSHYPSFLRLSSWTGEKTFTGWNGELGGFLWTEGNWAEGEIRRWIMNPFAWIEEYGQRLPPKDTCLGADAVTELAVDADSVLESWTEVDACLDLGINADAMLEEPLLADAALELAIEADADLCPEDAP